MAALSGESVGDTILKVRVFGVENTSTNWFLHPAKPTQSLESVLQEIFSGANPCVGQAKINELTGAEFDSDRFFNTFNVTAKVKVTRIADKADDGTWMDSPLNLSLSNVDLCGGYVRFLLEKKHAEDTPAEKTPVDWRKIFHGAHQQHLPKRLENPQRGTGQLRNTLISYLEEQTVGWFADEADKTGMEFVNVFSNSLWFLDGHHSTLASAGCTLPEVVRTKFSGFNLPSQHKHTTPKLTQRDLLHHSSKLYEQLELAWMNRSSWKGCKALVEQVASQMVKYHQYLSDHKAADADRHQSEVPLRSPSTSTEIIPMARNRSLVLDLYWDKTLRPVLDALMKEGDNLYQPIFLTDLLPSDRQKRYKCLRYLKENGFAEYDTCLYVYSSGNNLGNQHFIWKEDSGGDNHVQNRMHTIQDINDNIATYHTRHMQALAREKLNRMCPNMKAHEMRAVYTLLTGDSSVNSLSKDMDERISAVLENADEQILVDLRANNGRPPRFDDFWDVVQAFLADKTAVDDRRHDTMADGDVVTHFAMAMSMGDLYQQVKEKALEKGMSQKDIPKYEWFFLQFYPKNPWQKSALHYTGRFKVKSMVQQRQIRKSHPDAHYVGCVYKYQKEFAILNRENTVFLNMDDKAKVQIGEPDFLMASVARGRRVIVAENQTFQVADHDFSRMSFTPSVTLCSEIPSDIDGSFYQGQPCVGLKFSVTEGSSSYRHMAELSQYLPQVLGKDVPPIVCLYTDGGPDHNVTHHSVRLALIAYFLQNNLDVLVAVRTAPGHSYTNPAERMNALLNLGLQSVGIMRERLENEDLEKAITKCNNMQQLRVAIESNNTLKQQLVKSVKASSNLITNVVGKVALKGKKFLIFQPATQEQIDELFSELINIDPEASRNQTKQNMKPAMKKFMDHCCRERTYAFTIKKCGAESCDICKPPRLPHSTLTSIHHLPDPIPDSTNKHYKPFSDLYGKPEMEDSEEKWLPSKASKVERQSTSMPFTATTQHAKTVSKTICCVECQKPRVLYAARKVKADDQAKLDRCLDGYYYTCGAILQDLLDEDNPDNPDHQILDLVYVRANLSCQTPVEGPYYGITNFPLVCSYCANEEMADLVRTPGKYPICGACVQVGKAPIIKRGKRNLMERNA